MNLLKTSVLNGVAVLIKTATMFILNKILAIYVGPAGYAAIGQFQNFIQMVTTFAGSAINTAVIKYTAEYYEDESKQRNIWKTAGSIVLLFSLIFSLIILIFQKQLSLYIFHTDLYKTVFVWFAVFLTFFTFNALFLAILNGKKEVLRLVIANIVGSIFSLAVTSLLAIKYNLYGALVALSIYQSLAFLVTLFLCYKSEWFKFTYLFGKIDKTVAKNFAAFALMALVSAICVPLSQMVIRSYLTYEYGLTYAGYWEAMIRLSAAYLMLVTTTLGVYYLPRLSELSEIKEIKAEVYTGYKFIFPLAALGGLTVYILRDWIIAILFTKTFLPMRDLFLWQMIGDSLKIGSWILAYLMLSKAMTKLFITTEVIFAITSILLTYICTQIFGFEGVSIAHLINYGMYWFVMSICIFKSLKEKGTI
ncbi:O-antigen translocase [Acinetobacter baumannii]|uniref:O-antigen translocase n=1 Tax=Acinetobacter calcoaceticus/baumannii complex TaxID=909768 RepID=UPI0002BBBD5E|nr:MULTISPECIES: oligosaccharide flippase family protein [Acinetobacter calcoaceticus/baumannii complex]MBF9261425.1 O-antigen translocase [Acinetobacter baumannii]MCR0076024.1 O-antigen translocase [Acinetobacter baumannii]MDC5165874.1 O-antigen translocase [Acinetobacter baumannii]MDO7227844.1 O-antigen translocase [Acinetobacter baumannii]MDO7508391.1 O-antigen translocase [Acinetobacter baumannii]